jgi:hypothetical protein
MFVETNPLASKSHTDLEKNFDFLYYLMKREEIGAA